MRTSFAPMEGITGYVFRNAHRAVYRGADRYFTPFLAPGASHVLSSREKNDILPENNRNVCLIPQILTNRAEDFLWLCGVLADYGYREVNLNLGCPSGTVTAKKKGAGFLLFRGELDRFLESVFEGIYSEELPVRVSVKTRIGMEDPGEFPDLLAIYNRYPLSELIIHPRIRNDYYEGFPRMEYFRTGLMESAAPVSYNGNLFSAADAKAVAKEWEKVRPGMEQSFMLGRGAVASPWIFEEICHESDKPCSAGDIRDRFIRFHDLLLEGYEEIMSGDRNVLFKMKELWFYLGCHFPGCEKEMKRIKKAQKLSDYRDAAARLMADSRFDADLFFTG